MGGEVGRNRHEPPYGRGVSWGVSYPPHEGTMLVVGNKTGSGQIRTVPMR